MNPRISFEELEWEQRALGMRQKSVVAGGRQMRLVEFSPEFVEPDWCRRGHTGMVLKGELHLDVNGRTFVFGAGDVIALAAGDDMKHRHVAGSPFALVFLVEEPPQP